MSSPAVEKMEDVKPSAASANSSQVDGEHGDTADSRFTELCKNGLSMDEKSCRQAMKLFTETKHLLLTNISSLGNGTYEEAERYWFSFILYSFKRLSEKNADSEKEGTDSNGLTLCQILRVAKLNIADFFKELPQFVVKGGSILSNIYGADWENRLEAKELQANFVHLSILSKYYKRAFGEFFVANDANVEKQSAVAMTSDYASQYHRFGWLLFLALRVHAFSRFKDLVTCTNGLVSVLVSQSPVLL